MGLTKGNVPLPSREMGKPCSVEVAVTGKWKLYSLIDPEVWKNLENGGSVSKEGWTASLTGNGSEPARGSSRRIHLDNTHGCDATVTIKIGANEVTSEKFVIEVEVKAPPKPHLSDIALLSLEKAGILIPGSAGRLGAIEEDIHTALKAANGKNGLRS